MKKFQLKTTYSKILADTITPVSIYLKLRDKYPNSILLESSDYHGNEDIYSYICCQAIAGLKVENGILSINYPDDTHTSKKITKELNITEEIGNFSNSFQVEKLNFPFITGGVFGYCSYDAVRYFEEIEIESFPSDYRKIPDIQYQIYRYIIVFNHFNNEVFIIENTYGETHESEISKIEGYIKKRDFAAYRFNLIDREESNFTDEEFLKVLQKGVDHCHRGDVFQIVLSRRFSRQYNGDDFNVYRSLRSINPSPYLFYFDYGSFRIFGSSPEAQIVVKNGKSTIYPIAGTFRRTGDDISDYDLAKELLNDPKESAEHVMLVDLARNDLSRHCKNVQVETFKEVQYYSHVIHLVSKVTGQMHEKDNFAKIVGDTFPAGTLSGAPKHNAMKIINQLEHGNRGFYGGCIGFMGFNGEFNSAIMIRSILSKDNVLYYQAGAGVVALSSTKNELQEVNNKLAALKKAIEEAEKIY
ncbi:MAG TPA: anthranilate synthase component I family protein [Cytophagaceae bacterium]|jgi:anthranilate synthase component 1|nr:anthranilate synthase component I family protein [Cytophagaceae bacterium]